MVTWGGVWCFEILILILILLILSSYSGEDFPGNKHDVSFDTGPLPVLLANGSAERCQI